MSKPTAFWDASALVPLCVHEATTHQVRIWLRKFAPVVWWGSAVEVHSAVARLHQNDAINDVEKQGALARLLVLQRGWREILPNDSLRDLAGILLDTYALRAADSFQLAAALTWRQQSREQRSFIAGDQQLCDAATKAGFRVFQLPRPRADFL